MVGEESDGVMNETLQKVTLNLYESDVEWFKRTYGYGHTERMRNVLRDFIKKSEELKRKRDSGTLEELLKDK